MLFLLFLSRTINTRIPITNATTSTAIITILELPLLELEFPLSVTGDNVGLNVGSGDGEGDTFVDVVVDMVGDDDVV